MKTQTKQFLTVVFYIVFIILTGYFAFNYLFIDALKKSNYIGIDVCLTIWGLLIFKWIWVKIRTKF